MTAQKSLSIKGIAIILMLVHHLFTWGQAEYISISAIILPNNLTVEGFFGVFGKLCVTLYLFLSGYGFSSKYLKSNGNTVKVFESISTAWKVYRKYLITLAVFIPYGIIHEIYLADATTLIENITAFNTSYNQECWFLFVYILIVLFILPVLVKTQSKIGKKWIAIGSLVIIVCGYIFRFIIARSSFVWFKDTRLFFNIYYFMLSQFAFVVGWLAKRYNFFERVGRYKFHSIGWIISMSVLIILKVYCPGGMLIDTILTPFFVALCLKFVDLLKFGTNLLMILGKHSTYMWLTHTFFAFYYWDKFIYGFRYPVVILFVLVIVSLITSYVLEKIEGMIFVRGRNK